MDLDRTGSGKLIASVAVCAVWLLLFAASCGSIAPTVAPTEPVDSPLGEPNQRRGAGDPGQQPANTT